MAAEAPAAFHLVIPSSRYAWKLDRQFDATLGDVARDGIQLHPWGILEAGDMMLLLLPDHLHLLFEERHTESVCGGRQ